jgi:hypothetical protein
MAGLSEAVVEIDQDLFYTFLLDAGDLAETGGIALASPILGAPVPATAEAGSAPLTVNLPGTGYLEGLARVTFGGQAIASTWVSSSVMRITVDPTKVEEAGTAEIRVWHSGLKSGPQTFTFTDPAE